MVDGVKLLHSHTMKYQALHYVIALHSQTNLLFLTFPFHLIEQSEIWFSELNISWECPCCFSPKKYFMCGLKIHALVVCRCSSFCNLSLQLLAFQILVCFYAWSWNSYFESKTTLWSLQKATKSRLLESNSNWIWIRKGSSFSKSVHY